MRILGDLDLAEEAVQDAYVAALERWPRTGPPDDPAAWVFQTARNRALDVLRRRGVYAAKLRLLERRAATRSRAPTRRDYGSPVSSIADDRLRLIFLVCHPALGLEAQVALTLRTAASLHRPGRARLPGRRGDHGAAAGAGEGEDPRRRHPLPHAAARRAGGAHPGGAGGDLPGVHRGPTPAIPRRSLGEEAIGLARRLDALLPGRGAVRGLLALMLLHEARRPARYDAAGDLVLLEDQDRTLWAAR